MKKPLMICGMLAAVIYVGTVILGGFLRSDYSHMAEAISELVAVGAANRPLLSQDPGGLPTTTAGTMHIVLAGIASLGTMVAILALGLWFRNFRGLRGYVMKS
jgi:hypothetical protein